MYHPTAVGQSESRAGISSVAGRVLLNPRRARWTKQFRWVDNGERIEGIADVGRAAMAALELNHPIHVEARRNWISVGWHPPED
ncbi:MAG TPA: hypothetical protein VM533_00055 [Fimbriiglobus sp.]|nr:hypothetical protein [Fimbriiglobus sp.]